MCFIMTEFCHAMQLQNILAATDQHAYLRVLIDKRLFWSPHISDVTLKVS